MDLKEEEILGDRVDTHWYYASKAKAMRSYISKSHYDHVVDIGAGSGFFSKYALATGLCTRATCVDTGYADDHSEVIDGKQINFVRTFVPRDADLMLFMDVLEHVPDDVGLLRQYVEGAPLGSETFISVPAFEFMWSPHDDYLEHYRRYTVDRLSKVVTEAGLKVENCSYCFGAVFPIAATRRFARRLVEPADQPPRSDLMQHSAPVNFALRTLCTLERPLLRANKIAGLSVFCSARKVAT